MSPFAAREFARLILPHATIHDPRDFGLREQAEVFGLIEPRAGAMLV
jgi:hypothetical protein